MFDHGGLVHQREAEYNPGVVEDWVVWGSKRFMDNYDDHNVLSPVGIELIYSMSLDRNGSAR